MPKVIDRVLLDRFVQPVAKLTASPFGAAQAMANAGALVAALHAAVGAIMLNLAPLFALPLALAITFLLYKLAGRMDKTVDPGETNSLRERLVIPRIVALGFLLYAFAPLLIFGWSPTRILMLVEVACYVVSIYLVSCQRGSKVVAA